MNEGKVVIRGEDYWYMCSTYKLHYDSVQVFTQMTRARYMIYSVCQP